jgi:hypothetical protein
MRSEEREVLDCRQLTATVIDNCPMAQSNPRNEPADGAIGLDINIDLETQDVNVQWEATRW